MKALNVVPKGTEPNDEKALNEVQQQGTERGSARSARALTPATLDTILTGKPEKLWGAPAIARALGISVDTVYRWAQAGDCPISRPHGRYFAYRSSLEKWLRESHQTT